jgi:hypothetical protein
MRARWLINLALLALLALLGLAIRQELGAARAGLATLAGIGAPAPHLIEIVRLGEPTIRLEQLVTGWRMRAPWDLDADPEQVESLLAIRAAPLLRTLPAAAVALGELGLEPVKLLLRLDATELAIGDVDPIEQWRYVASGDLVHLIPDRFQPDLIAPPIALVARTLLPRDLVPVAGTLGEVTLSDATLVTLPDLVAERVEPLTGEARGTPLILSGADGDQLGFLISADGRRWSRPDLGLRYVLTEAPAWLLAPGMLEAPPPALTPSGESPARDLAPIHTDTWAAPAADAGRAAEWSTGGSEDWSAPAPRPADRAQDATWIDPDAPLSGDLPLGPPPEVKLRPHEALPETLPATAEPRPEPPREAPPGFGQDPFAPDPG